MPFTKAGNSVMKSMVAQYGPEKGPSVFYASINKGIAGSSKWHRVKKHQREDTTTAGISRYVPGDTWFDYKKKRKNWMQMGMSTFPREGGSSIACRRVYEGGPGSGRYKSGSVGMRIAAFRAARSARVSARARGASRWDRNYSTHRAIFKTMSRGKTEGGPGSGRYPAGSNQDRVAYALSHNRAGHKQPSGSRRQDHMIHIGILRNMLGHEHTTLKNKTTDELAKIHHDLHQQALAKGFVRDSHAKTEGGPGSGRYPRNSGEHAELVRKLNLIVQRAVAAKTGKASVAYRNAAMAVRARLAGRKPTSFGTVRDLYKMDFNYRPQLASLDTWFDYKNAIHEVGSASK